MTDSLLTVDALRTLLIERLDLDVDPSEIDERASFQDDLGLDSVDLLEFAIGIERTFGVKVTQNDTEAFVDLASLHAFCREHSAAVSAA